MRTVRVIEVRSLERNKYFLWRDLISSERFKPFESGILYYSGKKVDRFLAPQWKSHADALRAEYQRLADEVPEEYPFAMTIADVDQPKNIRVYIRGSKDNLGEEAPRQFLTVLSNGHQTPFTKGSGRLELADAIVDPDESSYQPRVL